MSVYNQHLTCMQKYSHHSRVEHHQIIIHATPNVVALEVIEIKSIFGYNLNFSQYVGNI